MFQFSGFHCMVSEGCRKGSSSRSPNLISTATGHSSCQSAPLKFMCSILPGLSREAKREGFASRCPVSVWSVLVRMPLSLILCAIQEGYEPLQSGFKNS